MRDFEFRGKRTDTGEWVYGLGLNCFSDLKTPVIWIEQPPDGGSIGCFVDPDTVGQFTGLRDKNSEKVYEGDIAKDVYGNVGIIEWSEAGARFQWCSKGKCYSLINSPVRFEVIGNIHDNPDKIPVETN